MKKIFVFPNVEIMKELAKKQKFFREGKGFVYIIEFENYVKIGLSIDPITRILLVVGIGKNYSFSATKRIAVSPPLIAYKAIEKKLHTQFAQYRQNAGELFSIDFETALRALSELEDCSEPNTTKFDFRRNAPTEINPVLMVDNPRLFHYIDFVKSKRFLES